MIRACASTPPVRRPDLAVYAQHKHAGQRPWNQVERVGDQPVVYPGARLARVATSRAACTGPATGSTSPTASAPSPALQLHIISDAAGRGRMGDLARALGRHPAARRTTSIPFDDSSPRGPGGHPRVPCSPTRSWPPPRPTRRPSPRPHRGAAPAPAPTDLRRRRRAATSTSTYDARVEHPAGLVVSIGDLAKIPNRRLLLPDPGRPRHRNDHDTERRQRPNAAHPRQHRHPGCLRLAGHAVHAQARLSRQRFARNAIARRLRPAAR